MTYQEYLQLPETRTAPWDAEELKAMAESDNNPEVQNLPEYAASLIIKYCMVHNYRYCDQTLKRALAELRPLFHANLEPTVPSEIELSSASKQYLETHGLQPWSERHSTAQQAEKESKSLMHEVATEMDKKAHEAKFHFALNDVEKLDGSSLVGQSNRDRESGLVAGRSQGMVAHGEKFRQRIQAYEALKGEFNSPEEIREIDARIEREKSHLRW